MGSSDNGSTANDQGRRMGLLLGTFFRIKRRGSVEFFAVYISK